MNNSVITFDKAVKIISLFFICWFLILLTIMVCQMAKKAEIGRYQFHQNHGYKIDTKTGKTKTIRDNYKWSD